MATESHTGDAFGRVSRVKGIVFQYLTLAASLVGIVSLVVLLSYVGYDAFGLEEASPAWYVVYGVTLVVPALGFLAYARLRPPVMESTAGVVAVLLGGTLASVSSIIVLSIIVGPDVWFAHSVYILGPALALLGYARFVDDDAAWTGSAAGAWLIVGTVTTAIDDVLLAVGRQLASPFDVVTMPERLLVLAGELLGTPGIYYLTVLLPVAFAADGYLRDRIGERNAHVVAGGILLLTITAIPVVDGLGPVSRGVWVLAVAGLGTPIVVFTVCTIDDESRRVGLAFPVLIAAGWFIGRVVVELFSVARPQPWFDWQFLTSAPSATATEVGLYPGIIGSIFVIVLVAILTLVLGVGAAIYLEEYARSRGALGTVTRFIQVNISNLAGVPSIVYGLLGLGLFIKLLGMGFGTVIVASMTLSLLILPIVIISAQEAIRAVPDELRRASRGMGATKWQTIRTVVLPESLPGILTGTILALGRAIGETAPLILIGIPNFVTWTPEGMFSRATAMPMLIYQWAFYPDDGFRYGVVAAAVITLLTVLFAMNSIAIFVRNKYQRSA